LQKPLTAQLVGAAVVAGLFSIGHLGVLLFFAQDRLEFDRFFVAVHQRLAAVERLRREADEYPPTTWNFEEFRDDHTRDFQYLGSDVEKIDITNPERFIASLDQEVLSLRVRSARLVRDRGEADTTWIGALGVVNGIFLLIFLAVLYRLHHTIALPLSRLSRAIHLYRDGDLTSRVSPDPNSQVAFLEASFNDLAERLQTLVTDLRKVDEMKTDFVSTVSHELRTPLTSIGGYVKLLLAGDAGEVSTTQREFLEIVRTNVKRLSLLINDLLDVDKIESGMIQLVREPHELGSILKECKLTFDVLAQQKGLELLLDNRSPGAMVFGDRGRLIQVFMNLISNAIKYTSKGTVTIISEKSGPNVVVTIQDTGQGMDKPELEALFQKFSRTRSALESHEGGTGLGLVIVKGLIEAHGGAIHVESEWEKGSSFAVTLPGFETDLDDQSDSELGDVELGNELWVLSASRFVAQRYVENILGAAEIQFDGVARTFGLLSSNELDLGGANKPALIVFDIDEVDDWSTLIDLFQSPKFEGTPLIVVCEARHFDEAKQSNATQVLVKPVEQDALRDLVGNYLEVSRPRVLLIQKDSQVGDIVRRELDRKWSATLAQTGEEALQAFEGDDKIDAMVITSTVSDVSISKLIGMVKAEHRDCAILLVGGETEFPQLRSIQATGVEVLRADVSESDQIMRRLAELVYER
jgi:signal transduction histidine kinase